ncbi:MAG: endonuclease III [Spirochaetaceae bacterium]
MTPSNRARAIFERLDPLYPDKSPPLAYSSPYELLVAVILSAQTTDAQVNRVTPELFRRYPTPRALAAADEEELASLIFSTGFYRAKARSIRAAARMLVEEYEGELPDRIDELTRLPGVGRKTANVLLGVIHGHPAIVVDTHFARVVRRIGFTAARNPDRIERELRAVVPAEIRTAFSMIVNFHGRAVCTARKPRCYECPIEDLCTFAEKTPAPREVEDQVS